MAVPPNLGPSLFNLGITFSILYAIVLGILKLWRKVRGTSSENEDVDNLLINDETDVEKFKEYLEELKQFAKKVSEDKMDLQRLTSEPEGFPFNEVSLTSLEGQYRALQEEMEAILEECCRASKTHLEEPRQAVDRFQEEYARFCDDMERVLKTVQVRLQAPRKAKKRRTETAVETVGDGEEKYLREIAKNDQISSVLTAIRSCMNKIIIESRWNWKKTVIDISEFLGQNYQEIKVQLETSIKEASTSKKCDKTQLVDIRHQTDAIEKQMLDIFLTVERQAADFHAVHDTLQFFNRKFALFSEKCHSKWDAHCGRHDAACAHVHKVQEGLERGAARLAEASARLAAQAPEAVALLGRMQGTGDGVAASVRELRDAVQSTEVSVTSRLEKLAEALRKQGERLCPVLRAVEDLGLLDDLVRSSKAAVEAHPETSVEDGQWGESPSRQIISIVDDAILKTKSKYPSIQRGMLVGEGKDNQVLGFVRTPRPHPFMIHLHRELSELRKTTHQLSKDWTDMNHLVNIVRDQQKRFMFHIQTDLQSFHEGLSTTLSARLREEGVRAELRSAALARTVEALVTQVAQMRQAMRQRAEVLVTLKPSPVVDGWSQTEYRKKMVDGKVPPMPDQDTIKTLVIAIKQALVEFLKEAQKSVARERAEMAESVRVIFTQMASDREDIKAAISGAFSASSQQTQRCFEQLGILGRDAVGCIVSLGGKSEKTSDVRFQELAAKTRDVSRSVKVVDISVSSIKDTLDSIDSQFDEIYRKLELSQQAHSEQCAEIADRMAVANREFADKSDALDAKHQQMVELIGRVNEAINRFNNNRESDIKPDQTTGVELHALVKTCGHRVQLLTATLEQFVSRVEEPMLQVVYQTKMLTDMIGSRLEGSVGQSSILESPSSHDLLQCIEDSSVDSSAAELRDGGVVEGDFKDLMREMFLKGNMLGSEISNATCTTDTSKTDS